MAGQRQLALPFPHEPDFARADFLEAPSNAAALAWLRRTRDWPNRRLALWGDSGCGKTHLLHLWARTAGADRHAGSALRSGLIEMPRCGGIAVDDADLAAEQPLLHLLNAAEQARLPVLVTGRRPPARWQVRLPDLASRLRALTVIGIAPPEDALLRALLTSVLAERQLVVPPSVQQWLLARLPRTQAAVREVAAKLDHAALVSGTRITRRLAATVLQDWDHDGSMQVHEIPAPPGDSGSSKLPQLL